MATAQMIFEVAAIAWKAIKPHWELWAIFALAALLTFVPSSAPHAWTLLAIALSCLYLGRQTASVASPPEWPDQPPPRRTL